MERMTVKTILSVNGSDVDVITQIGDDVPGGAETRIVVYSRADVKVISTQVSQ